jgi:hypothetical protein
MYANKAMQTHPYENLKLFRPSMFQMQLTYPLPQLAILRCLLKETCTEETDLKAICG